MLFELVILLMFSAVSSLIMAIIYFFTAEDYHARARRAQLEATEHAQRAKMYRRSLEQATSRNNLLAAHSKEMEAEIETLHQRVLYLSALVKHNDSLAIARMAVMDGPSTLLPRDTINLN